MNSTGKEIDGNHQPAQGTTRTVHIHSELAGRITKLPFFEGESVNKNAVLASLDDDLLRTIIKAPYADVVSAHLKEPGDIVSVNEHILTLFDPGLMTAAVQVPEQLHSRISIKDTVKVRIDSLADLPLPEGYSLYDGGEVKTLQAGRLSIAWAGDIPGVCGHGGSIRVAA